MKGICHKSVESVFFYTFHKCASSLFGGYILPNADGLQHVNYAKLIYSGAIIHEEHVTFETGGHIYGPIRISVDTHSPVHKLLVDPTTDPNFIKDKMAVFFLRDPRDILVSSYYSFGYNHGISPVEEIRKLEEATRNSILGQTIDEYSLAKAEEQKIYFQTLDRLVKKCDKSTVIRYEDMIENFDMFSRQIKACIPLRDEILRGIYNQSRPKPKEDPKQHRRSGQVGGFRDHLQSATIESLNECFRDLLCLYGYTE